MKEKIKANLFKLNLLIFAIFTTLLSLVNVIKNQTNSSWEIFLFVIVFNISLFLILYYLHEKIEYKANFTRLVFCLITSLFFLWYLFSSLIYFNLGDYFSLKGFYFMWAITTIISKIIMIGTIFLSIFTLTVILYYLSGRRRKKAKKTKIPPQEYNGRYILLLLYMLLLIFLIIPEHYKNQLSPVTDSISKIIRNMKPIEIYKNITLLDDYNKSDKLFNFSIDNKPNIIIIMMESVSAEHVGAYGYSRNVTPNVDSFAEKAYLFNNAYSTAAHSEYSQTGFLSSRHTLINKNRNFFKDYPREFIWDILKKEDYSTFYISSQNDQWGNMDRYYDKKNLDKYYDANYDKNYDYGLGFSKQDYDEKTTNEILPILDNVSNPFFLYVNLQTTHYPYEYPSNNSYFYPDDPKLSQYSMRLESEYDKELNRYDNALLYVDKQIGKILDKLNERNLTSNSIIIITSDHGENLVGRNNQIRHGYGTYAEEINVPLLIHFPNKTREVVNERVRHLDVVPTIINIVGFETSNEFQGAEMAKNVPIISYAQNQHFKIGLIKNDIQYIWDMNKYRGEAYNLSADPKELDNLLKTKQDRLRYDEYRKVIMNWYNCQLKYYSKESWKKGETINCEI